MTPASSEDSSHGMFWIYAGLIVGSGLSLYANIKYTFIPPRSAPQWWPAGKPWDPSRYSPPGGALVLAASWPVLLYITTEVMIWKGWLAGRGWALVRGLSMLLVAAPVANASYHHLSGLLRYWFPDDVVTVWVGPLAIDGAVLMCTAALQSKAQRLRLQRQEAASAPSPSPVSPAPPSALAGDPGSPPVSTSGESWPVDGSPVIPGESTPAGAQKAADRPGLTDGRIDPALLSPAGRFPGPESSPVRAAAASGPVRDALWPAAVNEGASPAAEGSAAGGVADAFAVNLAPASVLTGDVGGSPVMPGGDGGSPVRLAGDSPVTWRQAAGPVGVTGEVVVPASGSPGKPVVPAGGFAGEDQGPAVGRSRAMPRLSDAQVADLAWELRPEGPFSANWLVETFKVGTGKATRVFRDRLAPELLARAAQVQILTDDASDVGQAPVGGGDGNEPIPTGWSPGRGVVQ